MSTEINYKAVVDGMRSFLDPSWNACEKCRCANRELYDLLAKHTPKPPTLRELCKEYVGLELAEQFYGKRGNALRHQIRQLLSEGEGDE